MSLSFATKSLNAAVPHGGIHLGRIPDPGEDAVGFFQSVRKGALPNSQCREAEAKLFFKLPVWGNVNVFSEVHPASEESYGDSQGASRIWGADRQLNSPTGPVMVNGGVDFALVVNDLP
jgi:hypothetical protein